MRGMQPKILPFATCWNRLKQQKPELFQDMDDDNPPPTSLATTGQAHTDRGIANPSSLAAAMEVLRNYAQREVTVYGERPADGSVVVECLSGWSIWS